MTEGTHNERVEATESKHGKELRLALRFLYSNPRKLSIPGWLKEAGELELAQKATMAGISESVKYSIKQIYVFLETAQAVDKKNISSFRSGITHEPVHWILQAKDQGLDYSCRTPLAHFLIAVYESNGDRTIPTVSSIAEIIGDQEKMQEVENQRKTLELSGGKVQYASSEDEAAALTEASKKFLEDIEGDHILNMDTNACYEEIKAELKRKLGFADVDDGDMIAALEPKR